jgi:hypothetical protein
MGVGESSKNVMLGKVLTPVKEMPKAPPTFKDFIWYISPAVIFSALAIGGFESLHTPFVFGYRGFLAGGMFFYTYATLLTCILQRELSRWAIATGDTPLLAPLRLRGGLGWVIFWFVANILGWFWPAWIAAAAVALSALIFGTTAYYIPIAIANIILIFLCFIFAPYITRVLEIVAYSTYILTVILLLICFGFIVVDAPSIAALGVFYSIVPTEQTFRDIALIIGTMGWLYLVPFSVQPGGGTENSWWFYWCREKKIGMGAYVGRVTGLRGKPEDVLTSATFDFNDKTQIERFKLWLKHLTKTLFFIYGFLGAWLWVYVIACVAYYVFRVLHPEFVVRAAGIEAALLIARAVGEIMGPAGYYIFLFLVAMQLWNVQFGTFDGFVRGTAEGLVHMFKSLRKMPFRNLYMIVLVIYAAMTIPALFVAQPYTLWLLANIFLALGFLTFTPVVMYLNNKYLPKEIRPHIIWTIILGIACVMWAVIGVLGLLEALGLIPKGFGFTPK